MRVDEMGRGFRHFGSNQLVSRWGDDDIGACFGGDLKGLEVVVRVSAVPKETGRVASSGRGGGAFEELVGQCVCQRQRRPARPARALPEHGTSRCGSPVGVVVHPGEIEDGCEIRQRAS